MEYSAYIREFVLKPRDTIPISLLLFVCMCQINAEVLVVLSSEAAPYKSASQTAQAELKRLGMTSRIVSLDKAKEEMPAIKDTEDVAVLTIGSKASKAMRGKISSGVTQIYCLVSNPKSLGLFEENTHGISTDVPVLEQLALIKSALPGTRKIGLVYNPALSAEKEAKEALEQALPEGWQLEALAVGQISEVPAAIRKVLGKRIDLLWTIPGPITGGASVARLILIIALRKKTPVFGFSKMFVRAGALIGTNIDPKKQGIHAGKLAYRVLTQDNGKTFHESPIYDTAVNLVVGKRLSIRLPSSVVNKATDVYGIR